MCSRLPRIVAAIIETSAVTWQFEIALQPDTPKQAVVFSATLNDPPASMEGTFRIAEYEGRFTGTKQ